ncbi:hypothetical protein GGR53DRAFT_492688 [Hypoxylon sp. FL1150]|nr:hypothetical protein GGR53DRAFT_492688 [Hypoxylon sp. FL1150]
MAEASQTLTENPPEKPQVVNPLALKRPVADPKDYVVRVGNGWTIGDGTFDRVRESRKAKKDIPYPRPVEDARQAVHALSSLQLSAEAPITPATLDCVSHALWSYQPEVIRRSVWIAPPAGPELWSADEEMRDEMYRRMAEEKLAFNERGEYHFVGELKEQPIVLWPIWVEDRWGKDWVLIAWYAQKSDPSIERYDSVRSYSIYDPRRSARPNQDGEHVPLIQRGLRIMRRLEYFFQVGNFKMDGCKPSTGWISPMAPDEISSGERCFAAIKNLLQIITDSAIAEKDWEGFPVFPPLSRWVYPYATRMEMTGLAAYLAVATHQWNARIAIECLEPHLGYQVVVDGELRIFKPDALAPTRQIPDFTQANYFYPSQEQETTKDSEMDPEVEEA